MVGYELNDEDDDGDDDGDGSESCTGIFEHLLLANHTSEVDILILLLPLAGRVEEPAMMGIVVIEAVCSSPIDIRLICTAQPALVIGQ